MGNKLAGIQYMGKAGITQECLDAVLCLIQYDEKIMKARILSASGRHALLLTISPHDLVAIKSGFGTGYTGEGPRKFSYLLKLFDAHDIPMEEYEVAGSLLDRIDNSSLTDSDIEKINSSKQVHPTRLYDYIDFQHYEDHKNGTLWEEFRPVVPFAIIDRRIVDLAIDFWNNSDDKLMKGYRRLEDIVRDRIGSNEHGAKLFSKAFLGTSPILHWKGLSVGEQTARANLFTSAYSAHRNPRAHKETKTHGSSPLSEFLVLNHLYLLESQAVENTELQEESKES